MDSTATDTTDAALLRTVLNVQQEMICEWLADGTVRFCNVAYRGFFGCGDEVLGANLAGLVEWPAGGSLEQQVSTFLSGEDVLITRRSYGDGREVEWTDSAVRSADGSLVSIVSVGRDITNAVRLEHDLRRSITRFHTTLERISEGVVLLSRDLSLIQASPPRNSMLGHSLEHWVGADPLRLVHPDDRADVVRLVSALLRREAGPEARAEARLQRVDGAFVAVEINGVNLLDDPDVGALVLTFRSIDERIEAQRAAANRQLELETALRQRVGFIEEASHALRNPLHGMLGLSELLTQAELEPKYADAAWALFRQTSTMRRIVDDLLDHAQIEVGHLRVNVGSVDLQYVADDCSYLARSWAADGVQIVCPAVPLQLRVVQGDADRVRQVLANLLQNACAATTAGMVAIEVTKGSVEGTVRVAVSDDGPGFDPDDVDRLFLPYERGAASDPNGVGLGLAIARGAVEAMGGTIGAIPREGRGAAFWFELPLLGVPSVAATPPVADRSAVAAAPAPSLSVLVVDDDPVNLLLARMQVERLGCVVTTVVSGEDALVEMQRRDFDLAFVDVQMPGLNGLDLVRIVRAADGAQPLIAVMTASATAADREAAMSAGADRFVPKPATVADMLDVVEAARGMARLT